MKKIALIFSLFPVVAMAETDAEIALRDAMANVRSNCGGISAKMENIKKMAGIGTAVNAVGTAVGAGGVASGIIKQKTDVEMAKKMGEKASVDMLIQKLKEKELSPENQALLNREIVLHPDFEKNLNALAEEVSTDESGTKLSNLEKRSDELQNQIDSKQNKSTMAGNVRTGLFAVDTATNVAGAIVSSKTVVDGDFIEQIKLCTESIDLLRSARTRVKVEDGADSAPELMGQSQNILDKCSEYEYVNVQKLNNLGKGAMVVNSVGSVSGTAATITSVLGNNKRLSDMDFKTAEGAKEVKKYEQINMASNVLGGVTTAASLSGTVVNATQIKEAKKIINIAQECEEALQ